MKPSKNSILMKLLMVPYLILRKRFGQHSQVQKIEKISISGFLDDIFVERENRQKIASWIFITGVLVIFWIKSLNSSWVTIFKKKIMILISKSVLNWSTLFENYSKCRIWIFAYSANFCPIKTGLSGNTVWPQASGFQKLANLEHFGHF